MPQLAGAKASQRGAELKPIREKAFQIWQGNKDLKGEALNIQLASIGFQVSRSTVQGWIGRWGRGGGLAEFTQSMQDNHLVKAALKMGASVVPSWEDIIKAIPDRSELASLILDGFLKVIGERNEENNKLYEQINTANKTISSLSEQLKNITEDRQRLMQEYNNFLIKHKTGGHFTLDQAQHILIPKRPE